MQATTDHRLLVSLFRTTKVINPSFLIALEAANPRLYAVEAAQ
jgi:hypothetical protein